MMLKLLVLLLCTLVYSSRPYCDKKSVLQDIQKPTYDFSVRLLDRVAQETDGHFVFSPISTWLQLLALSDGTKGNSLIEILRITGYSRIKCLKKLIREVFNSIDKELSVSVKHCSVMVIDNLLNVKQSFVRRVENLKAAKVLNVNFKTFKESADKVNEIFKTNTNGTITEALDARDFIRSVFLMIDAACMRANWRFPFNPLYTKVDTFYSYDKVSIGNVSMMHQIGYFKVSYVPAIDAQAIELPFNDRLTMLLFLPNNGTAADIFWSMKEIRLSNIFTLLKTNGSTLVNLKMPRFKLTTDIDNIPELLFDMGIKRIFMPRIADFRRISNYKVYVSMMVNKADIEITETGVVGNVGPELLVSPEKFIDMYFNRPFAYLIADKLTNVILFAGIYSDPSLY